MNSPAPGGPVPRKKKLRSRKKKVPKKKVPDMPDLSGPSSSRPPPLTPETPLNPLASDTFSFLLSPAPPVGSPRPNPSRGSSRGSRRNNSRGGQRPATAASDLSTSPTISDVHHRGSPLHSEALGSLTGGQKDALLNSLACQIERLEEHNVDTAMSAHGAEVAAREER